MIKLSDRKNDAKDIFLQYCIEYDQKTVHSQSYMIVMFGSEQFGSWFFVEVFCR